MKLLFVLFFVILFHEKIYCQTEQWQTSVPMHTPRSGVCVASVGQKIYVIGGLSNATDTSNALTIVEEFDTTNNTWRNVAPLPMGLHDASASSNGSYIYVVGGYSLGWEIVHTLFQYNPEKNQWKQLPNMTTARAGLTSQIFDGKLYAIGGYDGNSELATNEVFDLTTRKWSSLTSMNHSREGLASALSGGLIFVIGGRNPGNLHTNEVYSPTTDQWDEKADLPTRRSGCAAVSLNGRIFVFGGEAESAINATEDYLVALNIWKCRAPMPTARYGLGAAVVGNNIYVLGGGTQPPLTDCNLNEVYTPGAFSDSGVCIGDTQTASSVEVSFSTVLILLLIFVNIV